MLIIFFDIKGIVHKVFVVAGQTVNSAYCCDVLRRPRENVRRLRQELRRQQNWLLNHENATSHTSFFTTGYLSKNKHDCRPHSPNFSLFARLKILKCSHFDAIEVNDAEAQAMLNTLTEHDFQDAFKMAEARKETTSRLMVASKPEVSF
jgi:hypothetical protein